VCELSQGDLTGVRLPGYRLSVAEAMYNDGSSTASAAAVCAAGAKFILELKDLFPGWSN